MFEGISLSKARQIISTLDHIMSCDLGQGDIYIRDSVQSDCSRSVNQSVSLRITSFRVCPSSGLTLKGLFNVLNTIKYILIFEVRHNNTIQHYICPRLSVALKQVFNCIFQIWMWMQWNDLKATSNWKRALKCYPLCVFWSLLDTKRKTILFPSYTKRWAANIAQNSNRARTDRKHVNISAHHY